MMNFPLIVYSFSAKWRLTNVLIVYKSISCSVLLTIMTDIIRIKDLNFWRNKKIYKFRTYDSYTRSKQEKTIRGKNRIICLKSKDTPDKTMKKSLLPHSPDTQNKGVKQQRQTYMKSVPGVHFFMTLMLLMLGFPKSTQVR